MKVKLTPVSIISFFCLVFLLHELHDWAHFWTAASFCGCLGSRAFDSWAPCIHCTASTSSGLALATLAGPAVNYLVIWWGWALMHPDNIPEKQSMGYAMVFAALPLPRILASLSGGGDETWGFRQLFQRSNGSNHYIVAGAGLLFVLLMCLPALIRAFVILAGWAQRVLFFLAFLLVPMVVDNWVVGKQLNKLLAQGFLHHKVLRGGTQMLVIIWLAVVLVLYLVTMKSLRTMLEPKEASV